MVEQVYDDAKFTGTRLPKDIKPSHYDISLKPNFDDFTFEGSVRIQFASGKWPVPNNLDCFNIVLHALDIKINQGHLITSDKLVSLKKVTYSKTSETATLEFSTQNDIEEKGSDSSSKGLYLTFTGFLNDNLKGFYRTSFKVKDKLLYAGTTQFATTDARRSFPCFDEPAQKASFSLEMIYNNSLPISELEDYKVIAISNTPAIETKAHDQGWTVTRFAKTPVMSTYLLAFVVGPFEFVEKLVDNRSLRVYTSYGKKEQAKFALEFGSKALNFYERYFDIPYPLAKMDMIALPDLSYSAMENFGLITYRESCLLVDSDNSSSATRQRNALVVAHEIAHQWFGNLVTMEWWTHLWLNEGFASFMQYLCTDSIHPEFDVWSQFVTNENSRALSLDALHNSHPIEVEVENSADINEIFDDISYRKGASVLRMLYTYIGDDCFRSGMKDYLNRFSYGNASTNHLWDALEKASGKPICKIMAGWTLQKGFPWISVTCSKEGGKTKLSLSQSKFTADGRLPPDEAHTTWMIPIDLTRGESPQTSQSLGLLESKTGDFLVVVNDNDWLKLNPGSIGVYRTAYPNEMTQKLWPAIKNQTMSAMDRLGLQNDLFALCQAGKVATVELLKLLEYFEEETSHTVWTSIDGCVGKLSILLSHTDFQDKFCEFGRKLYSSIFNKLGWDVQGDDKHTDAMTRAMVINRLVSLRDINIIQECKRRFDNHLARKVTLSADLRFAVYKAISAYGDDAAFDSLFEIYRSSGLHEEKNQILQALGCATDLNRITRVTNFILSEQNVRIGDTMFALTSMGVTNTLMAWKLLQDNKTWLKEKLGGTVLTGRILKSMTEHFASNQMALEVEKFFSVNKFPGVERSIQQALEAIRLNAAWLDRDSESLRLHLMSL